MTGDADVHYRRVMPCPCWHEQAEPQLHEQTAMLLHRELIEVRVLLKDGRLVQWYIPVKHCPACGWELIKEDSNGTR